MQKSAIVELQDLEMRKQRLVERARKEALVEIDKILGVLNSLGLNYELVEQNPANKKRTKTAALKSTAPHKISKRGSRVGTRKPKDAPCQICSFKTSPPHDRRAHRGQKIKKPFNKVELMEKGYQKNT